MGVGSKPPDKGFWEGLYDSTLGAAGQAINEKLGQAGQEWKDGNYIGAIGDATLGAIGGAIQAPFHETPTNGGTIAAAPLKKEVAWVPNIAPQQIYNSMAPAGDFSQTTAMTGGPDGATTRYSPNALRSNAFPPINITESGSYAPNLQGPPAPYTPDDKVYLDTPAPGNTLATPAGNAAPATIPATSTAPVDKPFDPVSLLPLLPAATSAVSGIGAVVAGNEQAKAAEAGADIESQGYLDAAKGLSTAATQSADAQVLGNNNAGVLAKDQYGYQQGLLQPWQQSGTQALGQLNSMAADPTQFGMDQFQQDPGYAFRLSEGMKGVQNSAAARGGLAGGNALKATSNYGQQSASQEYQNSYNRYMEQKQNRQQQLQALAGYGQNATNQGVSASQNYANTGGGYMTGAANAKAGGIQGAANATASGLINSSNALADGKTGGANARTAGAVAGLNMLNSAATGYGQYANSEKLVDALKKKVQ